MRRSIRNFNIPRETPRATPPGIWTFEDWLVQIPTPWAKIEATEQNLRREKWNKDTKTEIEATEQKLDRLLIV